MTNQIRQHRLQLLVFFALLAGTLLLEIIFLPESIPANAFWFLPVIAAVALIPPRIAIPLVLTTFAVYAAHAVIRSEPAGLMIIVSVPSFGIVAILTSAAARKGFRQVNLVREALDQSPLAYAEFAFPGYRLTLTNGTFRNMLPDSDTGSRLRDFLPLNSARNLAAIMDEAVSKRARVDCPEFRVVDKSGREMYWRIDVVPVIQSGRGSVQAVSIFVFDVTDNFIRNRTRESALRISAAVMSSLEMDETLNMILQNLTYSTSSDSGLLFLVEDEQWVCKAAIGRLSIDKAERLRFPYDDLWPAVESVLGRRARTSSESLNEFISSGAPIPELQAASNLVVPLISANRTIGVVWCLRSHDSQQFSSEQLEFATVVGSQAALAVENATIYENERSMRRSLEAIEAVSEAGLSSLDVKSVLVELVTRTYDVMQMDAAVILLADARRERLVVRAAAGTIEIPEDQTSIGSGEALAGRAFLGSAPMKIDDIRGHEEEMLPFAADSGVRSVLAVPLRINNRTSGILQIGSLREQAFSAREWGLIQVLAERASHAVQNSILHEQTREELARVKMLRDVAAACAGVDSLRQIAESALTAFYEQMGCATAGIFYHDKKRDALVNLAFLGHPEPVSRDLEVIDINRDTLLNKAVLECTLVTHDNWPDLSRDQAQVLADLDALDNRRAALPIVYKQQVVGGMALTMPGQDPWSETELETLKSIANQIAVAIASSEAPALDFTPARTVD